jgi:hypothetical protein
MSATPEMMKLESFTADASPPNTLPVNHVELSSPIIEETKSELAKACPSNSPKAVNTDSNVVVGSEGDDSVKPSCSSPKNKPLTDGDSLDKRVRRRRSLGAEGEAPTTGRRKSLRDKVLSSIVDSTLALGEALIPHNDDQDKYAAHGSGSGSGESSKEAQAGSNTKQAPARRASFGDHIPRRKSLRDKILGHIIEAAIMGVSSDSNKTEQSNPNHPQQEVPPNQGKENDVEIIPQN